MKSFHLKSSLIIALIASTIMLGAWEMYWRSKPDMYRVGIEDDRYFWSEHRARVEKAGQEDVIIIGSSRTGYNIVTQTWKEVQGVDPIKLAIDGKPPGPVLEDIVSNTDFNGTLVVGVAPGLFFSSKSSSRWQGAQQWVDHYHNQTYAQKLGHYLSKPLQRNLVMLTSSELEFYNDLDLKSLLARYNTPDARTGNNWSLYKFGYLDEQRNIIMLDKMTEDPEFAKKITDAWASFLPYIPKYNEDIEKSVSEQIDFYETLIEKFKNKGGRMIFIRHKSEKQWNDPFQELLPREQVYDKFIQTVDCPSYHFKDHAFMNKYTLPDWSHMASDDAVNYTRDLANKLIEDGLVKVPSNH